MEIQGRETEAYKLIDWPSAQSYAIKRGSTGFFCEAQILLLWVLWGPCQTLEGFFLVGMLLGQVASCDLGEGTEC